MFEESFNVPATAAELPIETMSPVTVVVPAVLYSVLKTLRTFPERVKVSLVSKPSEKSTIFPEYVLVPVVNVGVGLKETFKRLPPVKVSNAVELTLIPPPETRPSTDTAIAVPFVRESALRLKTLLVVDPEFKVRVVATSVLPRVITSALVAPVPIFIVFAILEVKRLPVKDVAPPAGRSKVTASLSLVVVIRK